MLEQWIYRGVVDDSYGEFMVQEDTSINRDKSVKEYNDAYWEKRFDRLILHALSPLRVSASIGGVFMCIDGLRLSHGSFANTDHARGAAEHRYTVNNQHVPSFLAAMSDKILHTGKYLNVIRESGRSPQYVCLGPIPPHACLTHDR
jgi:hypothetical protein